MLYPVLETAPAWLKSLIGLLLEDLGGLSSRVRFRVPPGSIPIP
jgi:hypothetical protein